MRIVLDLQGAQTESRFRGIGRYTISLAEAIIKNRGEHEIILLLNGLFPETIDSIRTRFSTLLPENNIRVWYSPDPIAEIDPNNQWRHNTALLVREAFLKSLNADFIHIFSLFEGYDNNAALSIGLLDDTPTSITLYDLIPLLNEGYYLQDTRYKKYYLEKIEFLKKASLHLAISEFSKKEAVKYLGINDSKIINVSTAADTYFKKIEINNEKHLPILNKLHITKSFVLYTGGADERKNLHKLLEAFSLLPSQIRNSHQLVFAGKLSESEIYTLKRTAKKYKLKNSDIIFTNFITNEELVVLYNLCQCFIFPSWYEGFGLPPLEAMQCGAPTIAARATSLIEVIEYENAMFDPSDVHSIKSKLLAVLTDNLFRANLIEMAQEQVKKFSWDKIAIKSIQAFETYHKEHCQTQKSTLSYNKLIQSIAELSKSFIPSEYDLINLAAALEKVFYSKKEPLSLDANSCINENILVKDKNDELYEFKK